MRFNFPVLIDKSNILARHTVHQMLIRLNCEIAKLVIWRCLKDSTVKYKTKCSILDFENRKCSRSLFSPLHSRRNRRLIRALLEYLCTVFRPQGNTPATQIRDPLKILTQVGRSGNSRSFSANNNSTLRAECQRRSDIVSGMGNRRLSRECG